VTRPTGDGLLLALLAFVAGVAVGVGVGVRWGG
jgi:hypothetical protein